VVPIRPPHLAAARRTPRLGYSGRGIAAAILLCGFLWLTGSKFEALRRSGEPHFTTAGGFNPAVRHTWKEVAVGRATVEMSPNFHSGIHCWLGAVKDWKKSWSFEPDGSVRIGQLALYRPSLDLSNYRLEFMAQVEQKSVGWVYRARDTKNYYAMKFNVVRSGARPAVSLVRYPVVNGRRGERTEVVAPITVLDGAPYRVVMSVRGNEFTTWVEGQRADSWTDDHLTTGGVGFCAFFFGQRPDAYFERGEPIFCGDAGGRRLVSYDQSPAKGDRARSL
jgi:hypothetical protein